MNDFEKAVNLQIARFEGRFKNKTQLDRQDGVRHFLVPVTNLPEEVKKESSIISKNHPGKAINRHKIKTGGSYSIFFTPPW